MDRYAFYSNVERYKNVNPEEYEKDAIKHYGITGQKWGQRRWQNPDGTFNQAGKERYFGSGKNEKNPDGVIGNSSNKKNPSGNMEGSVADHFHKNIYVKTDKNTLKKIKKYPDIYDTEGLTDKEILQAIRRVPKIPYSAEYGRQIREELYRAQMNKKRAKYYDDNSKDVSEEENLEDQKIEGFDPKEEKKAEKKAAEEAKKINDAFHGDYEQRSEAIKKLFNDKKFNEVYKNVGNAIKEKYKNEFDEIEKTYGDFDDVENEYLALAGLNSAIMYNDGKMKDIAYVPYLYLEEDLNQGDLTAEAIWAYDNDINDSWDKWDHMNEIEKNAKNDMISEFANNKSYESKIINNLDDYIKDSIKSYIWNNEVVPHSYWTLYNAGDTTKNEYDSVKNTSLKEAKNISKKLQPSCGNDANGWYYLNKAIDNLGMANMSYKELTDADWDKINAEVNKLKK